MTPRLGESLSTPEGKRRYARRLFATIADRYDLITVLLSFGRDAAWKRRLVRMADPGPGTRALDLACGTGDITYAIAARGARTIGLDVTPRMLEIARGKSQAMAAAFVGGDLMSLAFPTVAFDLVTAGDGVRNVPQIAPALAEIHRVLRPGGRFLSLDFDRPANPAVRGVYLAYLTVVGATLGWALHRDPDTYRYIPESIRRYPGAHGVAALLRDAGFTDCHVHPVFGGFMAINTAVAPQR
jgi:demethylmenaquinone methyltransferase/2-methoxy-6-polyprenyl-1,4-benzoquinol methylase